MKNNDNKIMGANAKKAPYEEEDVTTKKVRERIPVWLNDEELQTIAFTIEITETITEDLIINIVEYDWSFFREEMKRDVEYFLRENYENIQEITFWL